MLSQIPNAVQSTDPSKVNDTELVSPVSWDSPAEAPGTARETAPSGRNNSPGSASPKATSSTCADGLIAPRRECSLCTEPGSATSVFVTTILSAAATCLTDSGLRS